MILMRRRGIEGSLNRPWTLDFGLGTSERQNHHSTSWCEPGTLLIFHPDFTFDVAFAVFDPFARHRSLADQRLVHIGDVAVRIGQLFQGPLFSDPASYQLRQERAPQGSMDDHIPITLGQGVVLVVMDALGVPGDRTVEE